MSSARGLTALIYGGPKVGKSTLTFTAPYPRLLLDIEKGARFLPGHKKWWDPTREAPPVADGTWDTCVVDVNTWADIENAYRYLKTGQHQFLSVIVDSISETQAKAQESVVGRQAMQTQDWGELLRKLSFLCRDLRDLISHPTAPLEAVVITAMSTKLEGIHRPALQGSIKNLMPYWFDVCGYLYERQAPAADGTLVKARYLLTETNPEYVTGTRTSLPGTVSSPNIEGMLNTLFGEKVPPAAATAPTDATPQSDQTHDDTQEN